MGYRDKQTDWHQWFSTWTFIKIILAVLLAGTILGVILDRIAVHTDWYQILLIRTGTFLYENWIIPTGFTGILIVIGAFEIRSYQKKKKRFLEVRQRINSSQSARS